MLATCPGCWDSPPRCSSRKCACSSRNAQMPVTSRISRASCSSVGWSLESRPDMGKRLAVVGSPLGHTLSPAIHGAAIGMLGLDLTYEAMEIPLGVAGERLPEFFQGLRGADWLGCNVTVPYKQIVLA